MMLRYTTIESSNYIDCESFIGTTGKQECETYSNSCLWTSLECKSVNCWQFSSAIDCTIYQENYNCHWTQLSQLNHPICC